MTRISLISYFFFITFLLVLTLFISFNFLNVFPPIVAITMIIILILGMAGWMIKLLFAPLFMAAKNIDDIIKETLHELNIPIATIEANSSMLKKKIDDEKQQRQLERISQAASHLLHLHKRLNYLIKKEFEKAPVKTIDLKAFILERIESYQLIYPQAQFHTHLESLSIVTDPFGLQQALDNIISNSIKYAIKTPIIHITLKGDTLEILDEGKGMDENTILQIFQRYYQADRSQKGEGIGLNVVKNFCDTQKIRLNITSKPETFTKVVLQFQPKNILASSKSTP